jgi:subtilisin
MGRTPSLVLLHPTAHLMRTVDQFRSRYALQVEPLPLIHGFVCSDTLPSAVLAQEPAVCTVEVDQALESNGSSLPRRAVPEPLTRIRAPQAWALSEGAGVSIAVLDSGVDHQHPLLAANLGRGYNMVEPGRLPVDDSGHGTHITGLIAAERTWAPVIGVAPRALVHPVKILSKNGRGQLSDLIRGIGWAVDEQIPLINLSAGVPEPSDSLIRAVRAATAAGTLIIAAAGNGGGMVGYPAALPEVVAVTALDSKNQVAPFCATGTGVDLAAPGVSLLSTLPGGGTGRKSGTSFAAPLVSGAAALYMALHPQAKPAQVKEALLSSATPLPGVPITAAGAGRVDLWNLVNLPKQH